MTAQLGYGSYPASNGSGHAPKTIFTPSLIVSACLDPAQGIGRVYTQSATDLLRLGRAHTPAGHRF